MKLAISILFAAIAFAYLPTYIEEFETIKTFCFIAFSCFAIFWVDWKRILTDRIAQAILLFVLSAAISTCLSLDWHMSVFGNVKCRNGLLVSASYLVFYLAISQSFQDEWSALKLIDFILWCSGGVAIYAIAQVLGFDFKSWQGALTNSGYTRPLSSLGHPNFMANYLAMTLPFALFRMDNPRSRAAKYSYMALIAVSMIAIILSLSRGMFLAAIASIGAYFILINKKPVKTAIVLIGFLLVIAFGSLISDTFRHTALERYANLLTPGGPRMEYPTAAVRIWKDNPWFGVGTDAFEVGFDMQRTEHYWAIERAGSPHRAHNDFLNILATQGLFGAIAVILLTLAIAMRYVKSKSPFIAPAMAAIIAFYVAGLTSFMIVATGTLFLLAVSLLKVRPFVDSMIYEDES